MSKNSKNDNCPFPINLAIVKQFSLKFIFLDNRMKSQRWADHTFWNQLKIKVFILNCKGSKWLLWSNCSRQDKRKRPEVWKSLPWQEQNRLQIKYLQVQANFHQLPELSATNRFLRRFLRASTGVFTCRTLYVRPLQVNLYAPVLQRSKVEIALAYVKGAAGLFAVQFYPTLPNLWHMRLLRQDNLQTHSFPKRWSLLWRYKWHGHPVGFYLLLIGWKAGLAINIFF